MVRLERSGVGCHCKHLFAGCVCYADDLALLAPSPAALRLLLQQCETFATSYGLKFNASKTQLIRFGLSKSSLCSAKAIFGGQALHFVDSVVHLGHILQHDLDDTEDIIRCSRDMVKKANCMLRLFSCVGPFVKTKLFQSFCLSLYGCALWNLSCKSLGVIEVAFNNILRKIWKLPRHSHTRIVHCTARLCSLFNTALQRSQSLLERACSCNSAIIRLAFDPVSVLSFSGHNCTYGWRYLKNYHPQDLSVLTIYGGVAACMGTCRRLRTLFLLSRVH